VWGATTPRERRAMLVAWRADDPDAARAALSGRLELATRGTPVLAT
jgi:hypothetical protein